MWLQWIVKTVVRIGRPDRQDPRQQQTLSAKTCLGEQLEAAIHQHDTELYAFVCRLNDYIQFLASVADNFRAIHVSPTVSTELQHATCMYLTRWADHQSHMNAHKLLLVGTLPGQSDRVLVCCNASPAAGLDADVQTAFEALLQGDGQSTLYAYESLQLQAPPKKLHVARVMTHEYLQVVVDTTFECIRRSARYLLWMDALIDILREMSEPDVEACGYNKDVLDDALTGAEDVYARLVVGASSSWMLSHMKMKAYRK